MVLFSQLLSVELALEIAGTVLSCAGAPGKVLVPGGGSDDLLSSAEPVVDTPEQHEELQVQLSPFCAFMMIRLPKCLMKSNYGGWSAFALLISGIQALCKASCNCWLGHRAGSWATDMLACDPTYT